MEDYSRSYGGGGMQMERYCGQPQPRPPPFNDFRSYSVSASSAQTQVSNKDLKFKKGKSTSASSSSSWSFSDPEFQRKRRVASYKMYSVEGKMKGSLRKSFGWFKNKYTQMVYEIKASFSRCLTSKVIMAYAFNKAWVIGFLTNIFGAISMLRVLSLQNLMPSPKDKA